MKRALILRGPEGCGKSSIARMFADDKGAYRVIRGKDFEGSFAIGDALKDGPDTIIVEDPTKESLVRIKELVSSESIQIHIRGKLPVVSAKIPNFIVCTTGKDLNIDPNERRFVILDVPTI